MCQIGLYYSESFLDQRLLNFILSIALEADDRGQEEGEGRRCASELEISQLHIH